MLKSMALVAPVTCFLVLTTLGAASPGADQRAANDGAKAASAKTTEKKTAGKAVQKGGGGSGAVVFIDPATGQIRQPTPAEIGSLADQARSTAGTPSAPVTIQGPGGAVGVKLGEDSLSYTVVTKTPDGKLATECVTGSKQAETRANSGGVSKDAHHPETKDTRP